ncbi:MAG: hypothetical protein ACRDZN_07420 [Acidimicrobiales bacterium]
MAFAAVVSIIGHLAPASLVTAPATASPAAPTAPTAAAASAAPAAGVTRYFGKGAFEGIRRAVGETPRRCAITDNDLTAMVMAPVFKEVSMAETPDAVPSPMTLSRYDEWTGVRSGSSNLNANYGLYAFWDPYGTPYKRAYWAPGIGVFQYDPAGVGAPFTAAELINVEFIAKDVAAGMAGRYCAAGGDNARRRAAAWQPWGALGGIAKSEALFHEMVGLNIVPFSRIGLVDGVDNTGGMVRRDCLIGGKPIACWYVDPARAQGANWWARVDPGGGAVGSGEAPLSAPFYVVKRGGLEERHWMAEDTGYPIDLSARRRLGQNARPMNGQPRSGLQWIDHSGLCDTARPGMGCAPAPAREAAKAEPGAKPDAAEAEVAADGGKDAAQAKGARGEGQATPGADAANAQAAAKKRQALKAAALTKALERIRLVEPLRVTAQRAARRSAARGHVRAPATTTPSSITRLTRSGW